MLEQIIQAFRDDILTIIRAVMKSDVGINPKIGSNTLADSNLIKSIEVIATDDGDLVFDVMANDYIQYIESGRRKGAKLPPPEPIIKWAKRHGISTNNSTIWAIRKAISRDGIRPRPIFEHVIEEIDRKWDNEWSDALFDAITKIIDEFFEGK
jgi:hypothetical protein